MKYDLEEIKDRMNIVQLCHKLNIDCPDRMDCMIVAPWHDESKGSCHISGNAQRFYHFATCDSGDVFDFYKLATGVSENSKAYSDVAGMCGVSELSSRVLTPPRNSGVRRAAVEADECHAANIEMVVKSSVVPDPLPDGLRTIMSRKGWSDRTIRSLLDDRSIVFDGKGRMLYIYPNGVKARYDYSTSREDRWLFGGVRGNVWRGGACDDPGVRAVWMTEGESDLVTLMEDRPEGDGEAYVAFAGASARLSQVEAYRIGAYRDVYLLFDNDPAGRRCETEARAMLKAEGSLVYVIDWDRITIENGKTFNDLGDLPKKVMKNIDEYMMGV